MSSTAEHYDAFWASFVQSDLLPSSLLGEPKGFVHRSLGKPTPYLDFGNIYPFGFRATAVISAQKDELRAEFSCERAGRDIAAKLKDVRPTLGETCDPYLNYFCSNSNGKVELIWDNANVGNRNLWHYHHSWLIRSMELIITLIAPTLDKWHEGSE
jgi:hypothetical protein